MEDILRNIIYIAVILMFPVNVVTAIILMHLSSKYPGISALSERAVVAAILGIASLSGSMLAISRLSSVSIDPFLSIVLNGTSAIIIGIPSIYWLYRYLKGDFNDGSSSK